MAARGATSALPAAPRIGRPWRRLLLALVTLVALAYGWRVTRIDLYQLAVGLPNMRHIVAGLLQPDVATQGGESTVPEAGVGIGAVSGGAAATSPDGRLRVVPGVIGPGR